MRKPNTTQRAFQDRFIAEAERRVGMGRYTRGFMTEVARSLKLRQVSVVQRWLEGCMPRLPHLLKIYQEWGITPNYLLGIDETPTLAEAQKKGGMIGMKSGVPKKTFCRYFRAKNMDIINQCRDCKHL